jgi:hypothetical protein
LQTQRDATTGRVERGVIPRAGDAGFQVENIVFTRSVYDGIHLGCSQPKREEVLHVREGDKRARKKSRRLGFGEGKGEEEGSWEKGDFSVSRVRPMLCRICVFCFRLSPFSEALTLLVLPCITQNPLRVLPCLILTLFPVSPLPSFCAFLGISSCPHLHFSRDVYTSDTKSHICGNGKYLPPQDLSNVGSTHLCENVVASCFNPFAESDDNCTECVLCCGIEIPESNS